MDTYKKSVIRDFLVFFNKKPVIIKPNRENGESTLSKIIYNELQRKQLENNPNVSHVSDRSISYKPEFKVQAVKEYLQGKLPMEIFIDHGFDIEMIGVDKPQACLKRWRYSFEAHGEDGFYTERRGKGSTGRPSSKEPTLEEKLKKAEARNAFLEMEIDFLKKLKELERQAKKK